MAEGEMLGFGDPRTVTLDRALGATARFMLAAPLRWVPATVASALASALVLVALQGFALELGSLGIDVLGKWRASGDLAPAVIWTAFTSGAFFRLAGALGLAVVVGVVAQAWLLGGANAALRGRPAPWARRLVPFVLLGLASGALLFAVLALLVGLVVALAVGLVGGLEPPRLVAAVLLALAAIPSVILIILALLWTEARLALAPYALFDGAGVIASLRAAITLSRRAAARIIGWTLLVSLLGGFAGQAASVVTSPLGGFFLDPLAGVPAVLLTGLASGLVAGVAEAYRVFLLAILYESQRALAVPVEGGGPSATVVPHDPAP